MPSTPNLWFGKEQLWCSGRDSPLLAGLFVRDLKTENWWLHLSITLRGKRLRPPELYHLAKKDRFQIPAIKFCHFVSLKVNTSASLCQLYNLLPSPSPPLSPCIIGYQKWLRTSIFHMITPPQPYPHAHQHAPGRPRPTQVHSGVGTQKNFQITMLFIDWNKALFDIQSKRANGLVV